MLTYPTPEELPSLGLCPACLDGLPHATTADVQVIELAAAHYAGPVPVSQLPAFTVDEIDQAIESLEVQS